MKISAFFSRQKEDSMESANLPSLSINDKKVYEALFNNHIDLTFILDRDGTILNINKATSKTTGFSKKEMIGESFIPFVVEEYLDTSMQLFNKVLKGRTQNSIFAIKAKSGKPILVNCITIPITDGGEVVGAIGISKNITEEENLKKELDLNEQKYRSLFENHPDAVYILGLDGAFVDCNDSLCRLLGFSREELAYSFHSLVAEEFLDYTNECFVKAVEGTPQNYNTVGIHKNGQRIAVNITNIPMVMDGKIVGVFGIAKDITRSRAQEEALHKVQDSLVHAQKMANIGSWDYDYEANEAYWSLQMYKIFGMNPHAEFKASYETYLEFIHPSDRMRFISIFQQAIKNRKSFSIEYKIIRMDDEVRIVHQQSDILLKPSGEISRIIGTIHDITERRYAEKKLVESEKQFRNIYNNLDVAIWSIDILEPRVLFCSKGVENIFGYPASYFEECIEQLMNAIYPEDLLAIKNEFKQMKQGKTVKKQCRIFHSTGEIRWIEASIIPIIEEGQFLRIDGITTDITEQKRNQEVMNHLAHHDYLTDLPNRRKFDEELKLLIEECPSFAILYLDLDRFKHINDTLGHTIGDELLIEVANRLRTHSNQQMFISRMAGDEFSVLLKEPEDLDDAIKAGWSIRGAIQEPYFIQDYELHVTTSIGISLYPEDGNDADSILKHADAALYHAKQLGKNTVQVYHSSMNVESFKQYSLEKDMRTALQENQFFLHYQPRVETTTGKIVAAEALIRWSHPEWGIISPGEFIPLAEESGLIIDIGDWVLDEVCAQLSKWQEEGIQIVPVSVNVSANRFLRNNLTETIQATLEKYQIDSSFIEIEITESTMIQYHDAVFRTLEQLRDLGIKLVLDDFGTGYSSLTYLKKFKFDTLKIDRSFIQNLDTNPEDQAIAANLINLAHALNMNVVAEGVEQISHLERMKKKQCDQIQGFLFSRPVDHKEFAEKLKKKIIKPVVEKQKNLNKSKRRFFRVSFQYPLAANMTIIEINHKKVRLGTTEILIENIGPGGLRFASSINLPVRNDIILAIEAEIFGHTVRFKGTIVWSEDLHQGVCRYGFEFQLDEKDREKLLPLLNHLQIQLRKNPLIPDCSFVETSAEEHFAAK